MESCVENTMQENRGYWHYTPDSILLSIFEYLSPRELLTAGEVCKSWNRVSHDDFLWKDLFYRVYKVDANIGIMPGRVSWLGEFKRLQYHTPLLETEVVRDHKNQVLHVSFSHSGELFATCSKDGFVRIWGTQYPVTIKYVHDMKSFEWRFTQFSQFNSTDTLLLVSGIRYGSHHSNKGEIAVFQTTPEFIILRRVANKPYDIYGTWFDESHLLSGHLYSLGHFVTTSHICLHLAKKEEANVQNPLTRKLCRFYNKSASTIKGVIVANCIPPTASDTETEQNPSFSSTGETEKQISPTSTSVSPSLDNHVQQSEEPEVLHHASSRLQYSKLEGGFMNWRKLGDGFDYANPIKYNQEYRQVEMQKEVNGSDSENESLDDKNETASIDSSTRKNPGKDKLAGRTGKLLIFTTGSSTYTPHQIGFKKFPEVPPESKEIASEKQTDAEAYDQPDHLIDVHGHIIGMGLSPDHRFLYVNTRPWPRGYVITDPLRPPPIAQEVDIRVIDLVTLKVVGTMLRAHKAFTPNNECFFIFLDVSDEYVASGAEDKHGYLWDRHYGICITKFPHTDIVNSVAFNPQNPEMLVTTSDDFTIKVWRSRAMAKSLGLDEKAYDRGLEVRKRCQFHRSNCIVD